MYNNTKRSFILLTITLALFACSPRIHQGLEKAKYDLQTSKANPQIAANSPLILADAEQSLDEARHQWKKSRDTDEVDHLVYLTERKLDIARENAGKSLAQANSVVSQAEANLHAKSLAIESSNERARASNIISQHYREKAEDKEDQVNQLQSELKALKAEKTERGNVMTLSNDVIFEVNKADLKPGAVLQLNPLIKFLKQNLGIKVTIEGHTDSQGATDYNQDLSERRAQAVRSMLVAQNIEESRIAAKGMGEDFPVASNNSDAGRLQNRRVQIIFSN